MTSSIIATNKGTYFTVIYDTFFIYIILDYNMPVM